MHETDQQIDVLVDLIRTREAMNPHRLITGWGRHESKLPSTNSKVRDGVKIRFEHFGVTKDFVTECVQSIQSDSDVSCGDKFLGIKKTILKLLWNWGTGAIDTVPGVLCFRQSCKRMVCLRVWRRLRFRQSKAKCRRILTCTRLFFRHSLAPSYCREVCKYLGKLHYF